MKGRTELIIISVLLFLLSACTSAKTEEQLQIEENVESLKLMETSDMATVSSLVSGAQKELSIKRTALKTGAINYRDSFHNALIMGDSIAAGLVEYELLSPIQVVAARGRNLTTIDEDIHTVIQLAPTHIFFSYGMNDITFCNGDNSVFIERYEGVINQIKEGLPHVKLHVNAILPIEQHAIDEQPLYANYTNFNEALKDMCKRLGIDYIDNSSIIKLHEIPYNYDGIHPVYDFFPYWLDHMAERL